MPSSCVKYRPDRPKPYEAFIEDSRFKCGGWSKCFKLKRDAAALVREQETHKQKGSYITPSDGRIPFEDRYDIWLQGIISQDSTVTIKEAYARSLVLPSFGETAIADITADELQAWVKELVDGGYKPSTIYKAHLIIKKVLDRCVANNLLATNPCTFTELPPAQHEEQMFLTYDQVADLAAAIDPRYEPFVWLAAYGGLRAGEAFALRAHRVDLLRSEITVAENCVEVGSTIAFHRPKTTAGRRRVPVPRGVTAMLAEYMDSKGPGDLVFTAPGAKDSSDASAVRLRNFRKRIWYPATVAAGFGHMTECPGEGCESCRRRPSGSAPKRRPIHYSGLRIHDLRHTAVSFWIDQEVGALEIKHRAGHQSIKTTYDLYGHLIDKGERSAADEALERRFSESLARRQQGAASVRAIR
jgi:integrase